MRFRNLLLPVMVALGAMTFISCEDDPEPDPIPQPTETNQLPCDVQAVVEKHCSNCHGATPRFGAPTSLTDVDDWMAPSRIDPAEPMYHIAQERMNYEFTQSSGLSVQHAAFGPMPPAPNPMLNTAERAVMDRWIAGGLKGRASDKTCNAGGGPDPVDRWAEYSCDDIGGTEIKFLAHADRQRNVPFKVGRAEDAYFNFTFRAPWTRTVYGKIIKPVIDNDQALHHWLFFKNDSSADGDLRVKSSSGAHLEGELVNGWAPGGDSHYYGPDVGRSLEPGWYNLEVHYNSTDRNAEDMSGISICYVEEEPKNVAELVWVGSDNFLIPRRTWEGECDPRGPFPIHILSVTPHLHVEGRHAKAVINRADGSKEVIHDKPFNFDSQVTYNFPEDILLWPGDTITTTCEYASPTTFGKGTEDEMCYLYMTAWPVGALRSTSLGFIHGPNNCM